MPGKLSCLVAILAASLMPLMGARDAAAQDDPRAPQEAAGPPMRVFEALPRSVRESNEASDRMLSAAGASLSFGPNYLVVPRFQRWRPGQTLLVAFNGGDPAHYAEIESAAQDWTAPDAANLILSFRNPDGSFRTWTEDDISYRAHIRIAFNTSGELAGHWSMVGSNSVDHTREGGRPDEASMNLGFGSGPLPIAFRRTVLHEFGHALGFEHEHQYPAAACDFRFEDDPGYVPTTDFDGWYVNDDQGRRPGLYTFLGGYKNFWDEDKVDFNLRAIEVSSAFLAGPYDSTSIMKYFFEPFFFEKGVASPCYAPPNAGVLSSLDRQGARLAYPHDNDLALRVGQQDRQVLETFLLADNISEQLRSSAEGRLNARFEPDMLAPPSAP